MEEITGSVVHEITPSENALTAEGSHVESGTKTPAVETQGENTQQERDAKAMLAETANKGVKADADDTDAEPVVEAYKPNTKFKVLDTEHEIPKEFQSLMKDPESEKLVRELHEKAYGLDGVKAKLTETRNEREQFSKEANNFRSTIADVRQTYQKAVASGNYLKLDDFFAKLQIPQEVVMRYAVAKAQYQEMPPEQRQMVSSQMDAERRAEAANFQQQQFQSQMQEQAARMKRIEFDSVLSRPDVQAAQKNFETRIGKPGSFREAVARHGELRYFQSNGQVDLSPDQAVAEVLAQYGIAPGQQVVAPPQANIDAPVQATSGGKPVVQRTTKTIPNVQGGTASPVRKGFTSIDDIKKYREEKYPNP